MSISEKIARGMDAGLDPTVATPADAARGQLYELVDEWMRSPDSSGLIAMIKSEAETIDASLNVLRNTLGIFFNAGFSTTYATVGNITLRLLAQPEALVGNPGQDERDSGMMPNGVPG
jgi:cytochrome P450